MKKTIESHDDNCGLIPGRNKRTFSCSKHPDWLWGPLSLLFSGYWIGYSGLDEKLITLPSRIDIIELYLHCPV
jgi:hypothetical protein